MEIAGKLCEKKNADFDRLLPKLFTKEVDSYDPVLRTPAVHRRPRVELSVGYVEAAVPLRRRLRELRMLLAATDDPEEIWRYKRRIAELTPMLTQMNELAELTAHYYDRGYYRNEKYTV